MDAEFFYKNFFICVNLVNIRVYLRYRNHIFISVMRND